MTEINEQIAAEVLVLPWDEVVPGLPEQVVVAAGVIQHNHGNARAFTFLRVAACVSGGPARIPVSRLPFARHYSLRVDHRLQHLIADGWLTLADPGDEPRGVARAYALGPLVDQPPAMGPWEPDGHPQDCEQQAPHAM